MPVPPSSDHSMPDQVKQRDISSLAAWTVSSSKPGYGVEQLLDPRLDTLWQSEGPQPHYVNIQFRKRMPICISMFVDINRDDSYTPAKLSLRFGTHFGDLHEIQVVDLEQPTGWQHFKLGEVAATMDDLDDVDPDRHAVRANLIQIRVLSNHLNGKDTHIRHIKVYAPREPMVEILNNEESDLPPFTSPVFTQHRTLR